MLLVCVRASHRVARESFSGRWQLSPEVDYIKVFANVDWPAGSACEVDILLDLSILEKHVGSLWKAGWCESLVKPRNLTIIMSRSSSVCDIPT